MNRPTSVHVGTQEIKAYRSRPSNGRLRLAGRDSSRGAMAAEPSIIIVNAMKRARESDARVISQCAARAGDNFSCRQRERAMRLIFVGAYLLGEPAICQSFSPRLDPRRRPLSLVQFD